MAIEAHSLRAAVVLLLALLAPTSMRGALALWILAAHNDLAIGGCIAMLLLLSEAIFPSTPRRRSRAVSAGKRPAALFSDLTAAAIPVTERGEILTIKASHSLARTLRELLEASVLAAPVYDEPPLLEALHRSGWRPSNLRRKRFHGTVDVRDLLKAVLERWQQRDQVPGPFSSSPRKQARRSMKERLASSWPATATLLDSVLLARVEVDTTVRGESGSELVTASTPLTEVMAKLAGGSLQVCVMLPDGSDVASVITQRDLLRYAVQRLEGLQSESVNERFSRTLAQLGLVRSNLTAIDSSARLGDAIGLLVQNRIGALPLVDPVSGAMVGVFNASDVTKLRASGYLLDKLRLDLAIDLEQPVSSFLSA